MRYPLISGKLMNYHELSSYTTWKIGGPAEYFYYPTDLNDLIYFFKIWSKNKITVLGRGSNVLIRDGGINGLVICLDNNLNRLAMVNHNVIYAEAGITLADLVNHCTNLGMADAAFMVGIPGTLGGALRMNAGSYSSQIWDYVESVVTINDYGILTNRAAKEFTYYYRGIFGLNINEWFVAAKLKFEITSREKALSIAKNNLQKRKQSQPLDFPNCGSVFRNPPNLYAAKLIEDAGLKGKTIGGAKVSEKHANFIVNFDQATSCDVERLMELIINQVEKNYKITLIPEVQILGSYESISSP